MKIDDIKIAKYKKRYSFALIVDEQGIRRLYDEIIDGLKKNRGEKSKIKFFLDFSDNSSYETQDLKEVVEEENKDGRSLKGLKIEARNQDYFIKILFEEIKKGGGNSNIEVEVEAPDRQWVYVIMSIIEDRINSFRERSLSPGLDNVIAFITAFLISFLLSRFVKSFISPSLLIKKEGQANSDPVTAAFLIIGLFIFIGLAVLFSYLFPRLTFRIGMGIKRHDRILDLRSKLFWGVFIALALGIASKLLIEPFFQIILHRV